MNLNQVDNVHIIGIGGCASSAIAELLVSNGINVTGSEMKYRSGLSYLEDMGIIIKYSHAKENIYNNDKSPDILLYSPAITALNPDNPEILEAKRVNIPTMSWQMFIGNYLNSIGKTGITVSGSEGKGTTAGILTIILKGTKYDPLAILGAKIKNIDKESSSNIYFGRGDSYILEADEFNRNFHSYHPSINIMVNFKYEHPETYKNFDEYKESFYNYFKGMNDNKTLILRATNDIIDFINEYKLLEKFKIILYKDENIKSDIECNYTIIDHEINECGNFFKLKDNNDSTNDFHLPVLPGFMAENAAGAIIAAIELGVDIETIKKNLLNFKGMVRRFDLYKTGNNGIFITDYGHSPESIDHITKEIKSIFKDRKIHIIFQPHLFSRTYNFFDKFVEALKKADRVSLIDIYPARENPAEWENKVSSFAMYKKLKETGTDVYYAGKAGEINKNLHDKIDESEVSCFIGAGDMDLYYPELFEAFGTESYF